MTHDVKNRGEKTQDQSTTILQIYSTENREKRLKKNDKQVAQHCCDMDEALNLKPGTVSTNSDGFLRWCKAVATGCALATPQRIDFGIDPLYTTSATAAVIDYYRHQSIVCPSIRNCRLDFNGIVVIASYIHAVKENNIISCTWKIVMNTLYYICNNKFADLFSELRCTLGIWHVREMQEVYMQNFLLTHHTTCIEIYCILK